MSCVSWSYAEQVSSDGQCDNWCAAVYGQPLTQSSVLDPFAVTTAFKSLLGQHQLTTYVRTYIQLWQCLEAQLLVSFDELDTITLESLHVSHVLLQEALWNMHTMRYHCVDALHRDYWCFIACPAAIHRNLQCVFILVWNVSNSSTLCTFNL